MTAWRTIALAAAAAAILGAPGTAEASPVPGRPNCDVVPWGFLGSQRRILCDGPIQSDGSWMRLRLEYVPAHYSPATSSCSGGSYSSYCTFYPGGYVDDNIVDNETYPVTAATVLPDEPDHLGAGTLS